MQPGAYQLLGGEGIGGLPVIRCYPGMWGYQSIPNRAVGVSVSSSASANAYGTEVQVTAGLPFDAYLVAALVGCDGAAATDAYVQVGVTAGAAAPLIAEMKVMALAAITSTGMLAQTPVKFPFPIFIPAGTRIGAQIARSVATSVTYFVSYIVVPADEVSSLARARRAGMMGGAEPFHDHSRLPSVRNFGSGRTNSMRWLGIGPSTITAGTSSAYGGFTTGGSNVADFVITHILLSVPSATAQAFMQVGLGLGKAGKEYAASDIVLLHFPAIVASGGQHWRPFMLPVGLLVPRGTAIAARLATTTDSATASFFVGGYYARDLVQELATS